MVRSQQPTTIGLASFIVPLWEMDMLNRILNWLWPSRPQVITSNVAVSQGKWDLVNLEEHDYCAGCKIRFDEFVPVGIMGATGSLCVGCYAKCSRF
jgi:hypothetical protein